MITVLPQSKITWTEDRATQRCDPSAAPGAKTGVGTKSIGPALLCHSIIRTPGLAPSDTPSWHDATTTPAGCPHKFTNQPHPEFQFPLNQDTDLWQLIPMRFAAHIGNIIPICSVNWESTESFSLSHERDFASDIANTFTILESSRCCLRRLWSCMVFCFFRSSFRSRGAHRRVRDISIRGL